MLHWRGPIGLGLSASQSAYNLVSECADVLLRRNQNISRIMDASTPDTPCPLKHTAMNTWIPAALLSLLAAFCSSCANRGYLKAEQTSNSLTSAATQVEAARQHLQSTTSALSALVNQPSPDLRAGFERYRTSVEALEGAVKSVNAEADNMQKQGQQYFATWDAQIAQMQSENIRSRSTARQQEVAQQFAGIQQQYTNVRQQFGPLLARLRDIQRMVGVDLTPTGVKAAQEFSSPAQTEAAALQRTLDQLAAGFRNMSGALASSPRPTSR